MLLVEDDESIAGPLVDGLRRQNFEVTRVATAHDALPNLDGADVVLLDLGLPDGDGKDVCRAIRAASDVPVIVVSARADEIDRVLLLELGADDYMVKPFGFRELVARIGAVTRRAATQRADGDDDAMATFIAGPLQVDRRTRRVHVDGVEVALTPKEFDLLVALIADPGAVVSRGELIDRVWDPHWFGPTKTLDVHVASLRRKLGRPDLIDTVRGVGYRFGTAP